MGFGCVLVSFYLDLIIKLIDSTMEDWGLKSGHEGEACEAMDVDDVAKMDERRNEHREMLRRTNAQLALEVVENITESKKARVFLRLVRLNMYILFCLHVNAFLFLFFCVWTICHLSYMLCSLSLIVSHF